MGAVRRTAGGLQNCPTFIQFVPLNVVSNGYQI
jgi:hypothetical protein